MKWTCVVPYKANVVAADNLFTMYDLGGRPGLLHAKYGDPTPGTAPECR